MGDNGPMPEGDTLRHAELQLAPLLEGEVLVDAWFATLRGYRPRAGMRVDAVRAVGKHLLIDFAVGRPDRHLTLDTHLGMAGWWQARRGATARPADPRLRVALAVAGGQALCFAAPTVRTFVTGAGVAATPLALGPDLSDPTPDFALILARLGQLADPATPVADALLDQRIAAGVGNVFKSEACFVAGIDPHTPLAALDGPTRERLWRIAHQQLRANGTRPGPRHTAAGADHFVYGRARLPCRRCETPVSYEPAGPTARSTYWCPTCQRRR